MYNKVMSKNNNMENNNKESIRDICVIKLLQENTKNFQYFFNLVFTL